MPLKDSCRAFPGGPLSVYGSLSISFQAHVLSSLDPPEYIHQNGLQSAKIGIHPFIFFFLVPLTRCNCETVFQPAGSDPLKSLYVIKPWWRHLDPYFVFQQLIWLSALKKCKFPVGLELVSIFFFFFLLLQDKSNENLQDILHMEAWAHRSNASFAFPGDIFAPCKITADLGNRAPG